MRGGSRGSSSRRGGGWRGARRPRRGRGCRASAPPAAARGTPTGSWRRARSRTSRRAWLRLYKIFLLCQNLYCSQWSGSPVSGEVDEVLVAAGVVVGGGGEALAVEPAGLQSGAVVPDVDTVHGAHHHTANCTQPHCFCRYSDFLCDLAARVTVTCHVSCVTNVTRMSRPLVIVVITTYSEGRGSTDHW